MTTNLESLVSLSDADVSKGVAASRMRHNAFDLTARGLSEYALKTIFDPKDGTGGFTRISSVLIEEPTLPKVRVSLYKLHDQLTSILQAASGSPDRYVDRWSDHSGNQPFGKLSEDERSIRRKEIREDCVQQYRALCAFILTIRGELSMGNALYLLKERTE